MMCPSVGLLGATPLKIGYRLLMIDKSPCLPKLGPGIRK